MRHTVAARSPIRIDLYGHGARLSIGTRSTRGQYRLVVAPLDSEIERAAIERTVLDYFGGWFEGDPVRMERALHPELVKRSLDRDASGAESLRTISAQRMIEATAQGLGKDKNPGDLRIEIAIEDILGDLANVTVRSAVYIEYLHLARTADGWKIVNDVWQNTP
jgi:Putative lumazine-binding